MHLTFFFCIWSVESLVHPINWREICFKLRASYEKRNYYSPGRKPTKRRPYLNYESVTPSQFRILSGPEPRKTWPGPHPPTRGSDWKIRASNSNCIIGLTTDNVILGLARRLVWWSPVLQSFVFDILKWLKHHHSLFCNHITCSITCWKMFGMP